MPQIPVSKRWRQIATLATLAVFIITIAVLGRYSVVAEKPDVIRLDRWTGNIQACNIDGCADLTAKKYPEVAPITPNTRTITVTFDDGSKQIIGNVPLTMSYSQVVEKAERQFGIRVRDVCCLPEKTAH